MSTDPNSAPRHSLWRRAATTLRMLWRRPATTPRVPHQASLSEVSLRELGARLLSDQREAPTPERFAAQLVAAAQHLGVTEDLQLDSAAGQLTIASPAELGLAVRHGRVYLIDSSARSQPWRQHAALPREVVHATGLRGQATTLQRLINQEAALGDARSSAAEPVTGHPNLRS